jgi:glycosyltransferase involved in cell wall biosynthesis
MKTFKKRIWFVISSQNLGPHGGVGTFFSGFAAFCNKHNYKLDLILDTDVRHVMHGILKQWPDINYCCPENALGYREHDKWCSFTKERTNTARILNFQNAMRIAAQYHLPDVIISNAPESNYAVLNDGWHYLIPTVFYTHLDHTVHWNMGNGFVPFHPSMTDSLQTTFLNPKIHVGTQTKNNVETIHKHMKNINPNVICLPLICEQEFWDISATNNQNKDGILFIGRYEPRKNPELFLKTFGNFNRDRLQKNLPLVKARVLTNKTGEGKWREAFDSLNIPNLEYDIQHSLTGIPKLNFIKNNRVALITSKLESFGYAALEALHFMPTILISDFAWTQNFIEYGAILVDEKNVLDILESTYANNEGYYPTTNRYHEQADEAWTLFIASAKSNKKSNGGSRIYKAIESSNQMICYRDFFLNNVGRDIITHTDIEGAVAAKNSFSSIQTASDTYIMKPDVPIEFKNVAATKAANIENTDDDDDLWS